MVRSRSVPAPHGDAKSLLSPHCQPVLLSGKFTRELVLDPENGISTPIATGRNVDAATALGTGTGICLRVDRRHTAVAALCLEGVVRFRFAGALAMVWFLIGSQSGVAIAANGQASGSVTIRQLAALGEYIYYAVATVQLALVLVVARRRQLPARSVWTVLGVR